MTRENFSADTIADFLNLDGLDDGTKARLIALRNKGTWTAMMEYVSELGRVRAAARE